MSNANNTHSINNTRDNSKSSDTSDIFKPNLDSLAKCVHELETLNHILFLLQNRIETQRHTFTEKDFCTFEKNLHIIQKKYDTIAHGLSKRI